MSTEQNRAVVRRWVEEVINKQNLDVIEDVHTANYINHHLPPGIPQGPEGERIFSAMFFQAFPDGKFSVEHLLAEGDRVAMRYLYTGTQTGAFQTIPPTKKHVAVPGTNFLRLENGKIAE